MIRNHQIRKIKTLIYLLRIVLEPRKTILITQYDRPPVYKPSSNDTISQHRFPKLSWKTNITTLWNR